MAQVTPPSIEDLPGRRYKSQHEDTRELRPELYCFF
ncbi:Uncharacterized protein HZ326_26870, partial [Fusarium oxysporum f. sp. albedinis]